MCSNWGHTQMMPKSHAPSYSPLAWGPPAQGLPGNRDLVCHLTREQQSQLTLTAAVKPSPAANCAMSRHAAGLQPLNSQHTLAMFSRQGCSILLDISWMGDNRAVQALLTCVKETLQALHIHLQRAAADSAIPQLTMTGISRRDPHQEVDNVSVCIVLLSRNASCRAQRAWLR